MAVREDTLNVELARLLRERHDMDARAERGAGGKWLDVDVNVDGLHVAIEAKLDFKKRPQARNAADSRLKNLRNVAVALCYPKGATETSLPGDTLTWQIRTRRSGADDWQTGTVAQLAAAVRAAPASIEDVDKVAQILSDGLNAAVQRLSMPTRQALAQTIDLRPETAEEKRKLPPNQRAENYFVPAKRGMLVIATAMLFHHRVQGRIEPAPPDDWRGEWPPANPSQCAAEVEGTVARFRRAWQAILAVDYRPVFATAIAALNAIEPHPDHAQAVYALADTVADVAERMTGLRQDLLGRIFHRVLDTAKYDGSFYTSAAAATLLAGLAIREADRDWSSADAIAKLRVCDPACGTGTLLVAAAARIEALRREAGPIDADDEEALALCLVEDVLWGYDINVTATHMAATALGMLSPATQFQRLRIYRTLLGIYEGAAYAGSLEMLSPEQRMRILPWPAPLGQMDTGQPDDPPQMDLVIMNPPFTVDRLRHNQFSSEEKSQIGERERAIFDQLETANVVDLTANSASFAVLGELLLHKKHGTLALVMPAMIPTAPSGAGLRRFLAARFQIDTIVSSHDPERIFFSENTDISEVLIVCRRRSADDDKEPTRFVNLGRNPANTQEANAALRSWDRGEPTTDTIQYIESTRIAAGDWAAVNFLSPFLVDAFFDLRGRFARLSAIADVGPHRRRPHEAYNRSDLPTKTPWRALWFHRTAVTQSMRASPDSHLSAKPDKEEMAERYWRQRSRLLLANRARLHLTRSAAVMLDEPGLGSLWTPCKLHDGDDRTAAALCVWLNSSPGLLAFLGGRDNRALAYPQFSLDTLRSIPVPNFPELGDDARDALAAAYEELKDELLLPFPQMDEDPIRKRLDAAVTEALGLDAEWVAQVRRALGEEPSVTNRRYGSVAE